MTTRYQLNIIGIVFQNLEGYPDMELTSLSVFFGQGEPTLKYNLLVIFLHLHLPVLCLCHFVTTSLAAFSQVKRVRTLPTPLVLAQPGETLFAASQSCFIWSV